MFRERVLKALVGEPSPDADHEATRRMLITDVRNSILRRKAAAMPEFAAQANAYLAGAIEAALLHGARRLGPGSLASLTLDIRDSLSKGKAASIYTHLVEQREELYEPYAVLNTAETSKKLGSLLLSVDGVRMGAGVAGAGSVVSGSGVTDSPRSSPALSVAHTEPPPQCENDTPLSPLSHSAVAVEEAARVDSPVRISAARPGGEGMGPTGGRGSDRGGGDTPSDHTARSSTKTHRDGGHRPAGKKKKKKAKVAEISEMNFAGSDAEVMSPPRPPKTDGPQAEAVKTSGIDARAVEAGPSEHDPVEPTDEVGPIATESNKLKGEAGGAEAAMQERKRYSKPGQDPVVAMALARLVEGDKAKAEGRAECVHGEEECDGRRSDAESDDPMRRPSVGATPPLGFNLGILMKQHNTLARKSQPDLDQPSALLRSPPQGSQSELKLASSFNSHVANSASPLDHEEEMGLLSAGENEGISQEGDANERDESERGSPALGFNLTMLDKGLRCDVETEHVDGKAGGDLDGDTAGGVSASDNDCSGQTSGDREACHASDERGGVDDRCFDRPVDREVDVYSVATGKTVMTVSDIRSTTSTVRSGVYLPPGLLVADSDIAILDLPKGTPDDKWCPSCGADLTSGILPPRRFCHYFGSYFCQTCHLNDRAVIPSRVIRKWDTAPRKAKSLLLFCSERPMYNIKKLNPKLYRRVRDLGHMRLLRQQLHYINAFMRTCPRERQLRDIVGNDNLHLLSSKIDMYSINDLVRVAKGTFMPQIQKIVTESISHIMVKCELCRAKGFFCECCGSSTPIYSFQIITTVHCRNCHGLFHRECYNPQRCPRCLRRGLISTPMGLQY